MAEGHYAAAVELVTLCDRWQVDMPRPAATPRPIDLETFGLSKLIGTLRSLQSQIGDPVWLASLSANAEPVSAGGVSAGSWLELSYRLAWRVYRVLRFAAEDPGEFLVERPEITCIDAERLASNWPDARALLATFAPFDAARLHEHLIKERAALRVTETPNEARDKWLYELAMSGMAWKTIVFKLSKQHEFEPIGTIEGIRLAAKRYAETHYLPLIPERQRGRKPAR